MIQTDDSVQMIQTDDSVQMIQTDSDRYSNQFIRFI